MAKPKASFAESMKRKPPATAQQRAESEPTPAPQAVEQQPERAEKASTKPATQASRAGKSPLIAYVDKAFVRQLKQYCLDHDTTQQQVIIEALNEYFEKRQKAGIA